MPYIGKLDRKLYSCVTEDLVTDDVIITEERIAHIESHHPGHFELIKPFLRCALSDPDFILADAANTGLILKQICENDLRFQMVLRLHTSADPAGFQNSIISAWQIREKEYRRLLRKKIVLYKKE